MEQSVLNYTPRRSDKIHTHRRESSFRHSLILVDCDNCRTAIDVRFYGNGSRHYCCIWIDSRYGNGNSNDASGSDFAGGGGYHRDSAAMAGALEAAGVTLADDIAGCGDGAMREAIEALARHLGIARPLVVAAHP